MFWNSSKRTLASQHEKVESVAPKNIQMSVRPGKRHNHSIRFDMYRHRCDTTSKSRIFSSRNMYDGSIIIYLNEIFILITIKTKLDA